MCNGIPECSYDHLSDDFVLNRLKDFSDEDAELCDNCTGPGLSLCADQRSCVSDTIRCNGSEDCYDVSDELAENCNFCQNNFRGEQFRCTEHGLDRFRIKTSYFS